MGQLILNDRSARWLIAPVLGAAIGLGSGLLAKVSPFSAPFFSGLAYSALVSVVVWHGNRILWFEARRRPEWLRTPRRRAVILIFGSVPYSLAAAGGMLWAWYVWVHRTAPDWQVIGTGAALSAISAAMIVNIYETVLLIRERTADQLALEHMEQSKLQAELAMQLDPHFLFNSLHTLAGLTEENPAKATDYTILLADLYRYILDHRRLNLVPLTQELGFLANYFRLLALRFDDRVSLNVSVCPEEAARWTIPPVSLQLLAENAVKHNRFSGSAPLAVEVLLDPSDGGWVVVRNPNRPPEHPAPGTTTGLRNLDERCLLALQRRIDVRENAEWFEVRVPLRPAAV